MLRYSVVQIFLYLVWNFGHGWFVCVCVCFGCRRVPKLPWRWKTAKWLTAQHRQNTWGQRWDTHRPRTPSLSLSHSVRHKQCTVRYISSTENCLFYLRTPDSIRLHITKWSWVITKIFISRDPSFSILLLCWTYQWQCILCWATAAVPPPMPQVFPISLRASFPIELKLSSILRFLKMLYCSDIYIIVHYLLFCSFVQFT